MDFSFIFEWYYINLLLQGLLTTVILAGFAVALGTILAVGIALLRMTKYKVIRFVLGSYVEILRGTPVVIQLIIFYSLFHVPVILIGNYDLSPFVPGIFTLFINSSAYMAEVIRAGINSVDKGQWEASRSLGMNYHMTFKKIIFPQAIKNILPALGNEFVTLIKETSILMYSGVAELTYQANMIKSQTYGVMESYLVAALLYFALTFPTSKLMQHFERKLGKSDAK